MVFLIELFLNTTHPQLAKTQGNVFATDAILATLMCCTRSVNSWDIIVQRVGNKLFFDKRDNSDFGKRLLQLSATHFNGCQKAVSVLTLAIFWLNCRDYYKFGLVLICRTQQ